MHTIVLRTLRSLALFSYFVSLLTLTPLFTAAADQNTGKAAKKPAKTKRAKTNPAKSKPAAPASVAVTEDAALASFDTFTIEWMQKLAGTEEFQRTERAQVTESPEGVSAEYVGYLPQRYLIVKKTTSEETPFIGVLTYFEKILRCVGKTREEALQGPWEQTDTRQVSEIFRFTKGKWQY